VCWHFIASNMLLHCAGLAIGEDTEDDDDDDDTENLERESSFFTVSFFGSGLTLCPLRYALSDSASTVWQVVDQRPPCYRAISLPNL